MERGRGRAKWVRIMGGNGASHGGARGGGIRGGWRNGHRPWAVAGVVLLVVVICVTVVWAWRRINADAVLGAYELPAQSARRYTFEDMTDMVADCNDPDDSSESKAAFQIAPENSAGAASENEHPPKDIYLVVPAGDGKDPMRFEGFRCMAETLGMPDETQRDLIAQSKPFTEEAGAMPMDWNDLGFQGWHPNDGTFHLRITWYDPAALEE
ncbi:hypothetical protein [Bifidobacterium callitrichos]|uniref:hypothetical protein n=1 Tax=Bifidobacterium callitrichos TaxID=762209 RepID=UPI001C624AB7|nr:hypothetical protein [Bifidobacterium callitrichos]